MTRLRSFGLALLTIAVMIAPLACAPRRGLALRPWDADANQGRLRVYGAAADAPGPRVFRVLARRAELDDLLEREGEPDALEVIGRDGRVQRVVLLYWRRGAGRPRRIALQATPTGFVASAPQPLTRTRKTARGEREPAVEPTVEAAGGRVGDATAAPDATSCPGCSARQQPNATQRFECPIDRTRPDCRAYCDGGTRYEWCR